ncbi:MAG: hypothetical protein Q4F01_03715 [Staphylococcus rostri]|uniref:hypothetical protein n=1 Tax=Staphylococcus rostri TaxID=522262 RepID=UPI0026E06F4C|nr:hypothetical protein [Staphylococcus rostri]MDO5375272.1 hypothetical protein [Staphylococcus rostri]
MEKILKEKHIQHLSCTNDQGIIVKDDDVINLKSSKVDIKEIVENFLVSYDKKIYMTNYFRYITRLYPNESQSSSFINNLEYNDILIFLDAKYYPLLVWEPLRRNLIKLEGNRYIKYVSNEHFRIENVLFEDDYDACRKLVLDDLISCSLDNMKMVETYIGSVKDFTENSVASLIDKFEIYGVFLEHNTDIIEYLDNKELSYKRYGDVIYLYSDIKLPKDLCMDIIYFSIQGGNNNAAYFFMDKTILSEEDFINNRFAVKNERLLVVNHELDVSVLINI